MTKQNSIFLLLFILVSAMAAAMVSRHALPAFSDAGSFTVVLDAGHGE